MFNTDDEIKKIIKSNNPLNNISTLDILNKIERYRNIDLKRISNKKLFELTLETIPVCAVSSHVYRSGVKFYRLRGPIENEINDTNKLLYAPKECVKKRGRLNDVGESILYVSLDQVTPFYEIKAEVGKTYAMITYEVCEGESINASIIGKSNPEMIDTLTEQGVNNCKIIDQFFFSEFTKEVGVGTEYLYRTSLMIAKNFFDIPNCDAYEYPSVALNRNINLAIKSEAVDKKLKIIKVENIELLEMLDNRINFNKISESVDIGKYTVKYDR